jgi:RsiW-degrading membrane proteinase PrsW (M82 family)
MSGVVHVLSGVVWGVSVFGLHFVWGCPYLVCTLSGVVCGWSVVGPLLLTFDVTDGRRREEQQQQQRKQGNFVFLVVWY